MSHLIFFCEFDEFQDFVVRFPWSPTPTTKCARPRAVSSVVNRYYDPTTDQFLSIDPDVAAANQPYVFANDNPLNATDPEGNFWAALDDGGLSVAKQIKNVLNLLIGQGVSARQLVIAGDSLVANAILYGTGKLPAKRKQPTNSPPSTEGYFGVGGPGHTTTITLDQGCTFGMFFGGIATMTGGEAIALPAELGMVSDPILAFSFIVVGTGVFALGLTGVIGSTGHGPLACPSS
jgi:hypothetical protein